MPGLNFAPMSTSSVMSSWVQAQLDPTPKKVYGGRLDLEIDGLSLNEAIEMMSSLQIPAEAVESHVEFESNDDYASAYVTWYRLETPGQVQERVQRIQQDQQRQAQRRREQYEALRQEFEGE